MSAARSRFAVSVGRSWLATKVSARLSACFTFWREEALADDHPAYEYFLRRQAYALWGFAQLAPRGSDSEAVARRVLGLMEGMQVLWLRDPSVDWVEDWERVTAGIPELGAGD